MTILNADRWLYTQLTTDAQLTVLGGRVYVDVAPQGTITPFVVLTLVNSEQVSNWAADKVMDNELWQIAIWTDKSYTAIETIANRIRAVLHKASGTGVIGAVYERERRMMEKMGANEGRVNRAILMEFRLFVGG